MTERELQAIRERCEKATPGPWTPTVESDLGRFFTPTFAEAPFALMCKDDDADIAKKQAVADAEFLSNARADIPALLARLAALEAAGDRLAMLLRNRSDAAAHAALAAWQQAKDAAGEGKG